MAKKYRVLARTIVFKEVGVYEADSEEEALDMAYDEGDHELDLCHYCSEGISGVEVETLIAEEE